MNQIHADEYIDIGRHIHYWSSFGEEGAALLRDEHTAAYLRDLKMLVKYCKDVGLDVSRKLISNAIEELTPEKVVTLCERDVATQMREFDRCIRAELGSQLFFYVPANRARYMVLYLEDDVKVGEEIARFGPVLERFPRAYDDVCEAGLCFGAGAFTAAVFHLMRVCEFGLVSLAVAVGVDPAQSNWNKLLKDIDDELKKNSANKPPQFKEDEEFYSAASALMRNVKNAWRNPAAHIRRRFDEPRARLMFHTVEALMVHLVTRLSEQPMPAESGLRDPDAEPIADAGVSSSGVSSPPTRVEGQN